MGACADTLIKSRGAAPPNLAGALVGIGISSPGPIDPWHGVVIEPPNLGADFHDIPLATAMEEALGLPAYLDRDTNVAALAEMAFGAARSCADFIYVTVSTGIGGAIVSEGGLFLGPDGAAGELGHLPIALDGPRCGCGGIAHLEAFASGRALAREARAAVEAGLSPHLSNRAAAVGIEALSARDVAEGEDAGDRACAEIMSIARHAFGVACAGFVNVFNPSRIVVGGSIAEHQGERWLAPAREEIERSSFRTPGRRVRIIPAELGADVSLAGAYPLVTARLGDSAWRRGRPTLPIAASA